MQTMKMKMTKAIVMLLVGSMALNITACGKNTSKTESNVSVNNDTEDKNEKILVVYFSRMGNMDQDNNLDAVASASINLKDGKYVGNVEIMADYIAEKVGADDEVLIKTIEPYSANYDETVKKGESQNQKNIHPEIEINIDDLDSYDTVFLGYPIWNYTIPVAVASFLEQYDLSGKKIVLFGSSGGSGVEQTVKKVSKLQPNAEVSGGITINHNKILDDNLNDIIDEWLNEQGYH